MNHPQQPQTGDIKQEVPKSGEMSQQQESWQERVLSLDHSTLSML